MRDLNSNQSLTIGAFVPEVVCNLMFTEGIFAELRTSIQILISPLNHIFLSLPLIDFFYLMFFRSKRLYIKMNIVT